MYKYYLLFQNIWGLFSVRIGVVIKQLILCQIIMSFFKIFVVFWYGTVCPFVPWIFFNLIFHVLLFLKVYFTYNFAFTSKYMVCVVPIIVKRRISAFVNKKILVYSPFIICAFFIPYNEFFYPVWKIIKNVIFIHIAYRMSN